MHNPYPLADFKGKYNAREPFLSPKEGYRSIVNGRIFRGRLEKRAGYSLFGHTGNLPLTTENPDFSTATTASWNGPGGAIPVSITACTYHLGGLVAKQRGVWVTFPLIVPDQIEVYEESTGNILGTNDPFGDILVDWTQHSGYAGAGSPAASGSTREFPSRADLPITGLDTFLKDQVNHLLAFDTRSCYVWNTVDRWFEPQRIGALDYSIFTSQHDDLVWSWPTQEYLVFTNGVDPVYKYNPDDAFPISTMPTFYDPVNNPSFEIDTALLVFRFAGRLVYLLPTENGTRHGGRMRWTIPGSNETFDDDGLGFADAPAEFGEIRTGNFVGEQLFIGFDNGWMEIRSTGNPVQPLVWFPLTTRFGSGAKMTTIRDSSRLLSRSETTMQAIDPNGQYNIDNDIPDEVAEWNTNLGALSASARNEQSREFWWSFVSADNRHDGEDVDSSLVAQYDENNNLYWSVYNIGFRAFTQYEQTEDLTWDDLPGTWNDYAGRWDSQFVSSGFPIFLGATRFLAPEFNDMRDGVVYRIGLTNSDGGVDVRFESLSQALSPFPGRRSHMGWIDVYAEASPNSSVEISFYDKVGGAAYRTVVVDFSPDDNSPTGKVYRKVKVGRSADFHQVQIRTLSSTFFAIDALIPWFRPAGQSGNFG